MNVEETKESTMAFVPGSGSPEQKGGTLSALELLVELAERKRAIITITVVAAFIGAIIAAALPNRYTATTKILPPQQTQSSASVVLNQLSSMAGGSLASLAGKDIGLKNPNDIYIGMLKTRTIEDSLIRRFELMHVYGSKNMTTARKELERCSDLSSNREGFITVSVTDKDGSRAARVANAYVEELGNTTQILAVSEASQRRIFYEDRLEKAKTILSKAELDLKDTQQRTGLVQLDDQAKAMLEGTAAVRAQLVVKEVELQAIKAYATDKNTDVAMSQREIVALRSQLARMVSQTSEGKFDVPIGKMPSAGLEYMSRVRDLKYDENVYELLAKQLEIARLDEAKNAPAIQVVDPAIPPDLKSSPSRLLIIALSAGFGFVCAIAVALCQSALERANTDPRRAVLLQRLFTLLLPALRTDVSRGIPYRSWWMVLQRKSR